MRISLSFYRIRRANLLRGLVRARHNDYRTIGAWRVAMAQLRANPRG